MFWSQSSKRVPKAPSAEFLPESSSFGKNQSALSKPRTALANGILSKFGVRAAQRALARN